MKLSRFATVIVSAATTMALVLTLLGPDSVEAVDEGAEAAAGIKPTIQSPRLELDGLVIQLKLDKAEYAPGDKPVITLEVTNPTEQAVETELWMGMTASGVQDMLSRAPVLPQYFWNSQRNLTVAPGASQQLRLETDKPLEANKMISVTMSGANQPPAMAARLLMNLAENPTQRATSAPAPSSDL